MPIASQFGFMATMKHREQAIRYSIYIYSIAQVKYFHWLFTYSTENNSNYFPPYCGTVSARVALRHTNPIQDESKQGKPKGSTQYKLI